MIIYCKNCGENINITGDIKENFKTELEVNIRNLKAEKILVGMKWNFVYAGQEPP